MARASEEGAASADAPRDVGDGAESGMPRRHEDLEDALAGLAAIAKRQGRALAGLAGARARREEALAACLADLAGDPGGPDVVGPGSEVADGDVVLLVDVAKRRRSSRRAGSTLATARDGRLVGDDGTILAEGLAGLAPEGTRFALKVPTACAIGLAAARLGPAFDRVIALDDAVAAAEETVRACAREARETAGATVGVDEVAARCLRLVGALAAFQPEGDGREAVGEVIAAAWAAAPRDAMAVVVAMAGRRWAELLPVLQAHPRRVEPTRRGDPTPDWERSREGEGVLVARLREGTLAVVADEVGGARVTFRPLLPADLAEEARARLLDDAAYPSPEFTRIVGMGPAGVSGLAASARVASVGDALAAVATGLAEAPRGPRLGGWKPVGAVDGVAGRWRRKAAKGEYRLDVGATKASLAYGRRGWRETDLLFEAGTSEDDVGVTGVIRRWPEALDEVGTLVDMAVAVADRHASDGRELAPRRRGAGRRRR